VDKCEKGNIFACNLKALVKNGNPSTLELNV